MNITETINALLEKSKKPGVMSLAGVVAERRMARSLRIYFRSMGRALNSRLKPLAEQHDSASMARHVAEMEAGQVVRRYSSILLHIIASQVMTAMLKADKQDVFHEAKAKKTDVNGLTAQEAAQYASEEAAKQVQGINQTTVKRYADAVETAIEDQLGVGGLSRLLRDITEDMSVARAEGIARYEIADAFGEASMRKLKRLQIEYKQLILSPGACPICESIAENGPIPVDDEFEDEDGETYDRSPIHNNCRCATVGARGPQEEE